jgi:hypothetical protein
MNDTANSIYRSPVLPRPAHQLLEPDPRATREIYEPRNDLKIPDITRAYFGHLVLPARRDWYDVVELVCASNPRASNFVPIGVQDLGIATKIGMTETTHPIPVT